MKASVLIPVALLAAATASCRGQTSEEPPILVARNMWAQQRYNPQSRSSYFNDHRTMRTPPIGTVSQEEFVPGPDGNEDYELVSGRLEDDTGYVVTVPRRVVDAYPGGAEAFVARGRDRYNIYCTPCHGSSGHGDGIVWRRGSVTGYSFNQPPSFHYSEAQRDRLLHVPDGHLYNVIANGVRSMPSYAHQLPVTDRWAVVAYVRALQLSQSQPRSASNTTTTTNSTERAQ